jgi:hypothetical protein
MRDEHTNTSITRRKTNLIPGFPFLFVSLDVITNNLKKEWHITNFKIIYMFKYKEQTFYRSICTSLL